MSVDFSAFSVECTEFASSRKPNGGEDSASEQIKTKRDLLSLRSVILCMQYTFQ